MPVDNRWYDGVGAQWWEQHGPVAALHEVNPVRVEYFTQAIRRAFPAAARPRVLDLGCGGGLVAEGLAREGFAVTGIDASLSSLSAARDHAMALHDAQHYAGGDALRLPFAGGAFDDVVFADVIEHVGDPDRLLAEAARVMAPGGLFLFDTPNRTWFTRAGLIWAAELLGWAPRHMHDYRRLLTPEELVARCVHAGLVVREVRGLPLRASAPRAAWGYLRRRELGGFHVSDDLRLSFTGFATLARDGRGRRGGASASTAVSARARSTHVRDSHHERWKPDAAGLVVVPVHGNRDVPAGTLRSVLRQGRPEHRGTR